MSKFTSINETCFNESKDNFDIGFDEQELLENDVHQSDETDIEFDDSIFDEAYAQVESQQERESKEYQKSLFNELANNLSNKIEQSSANKVNDLETEEKPFRDTVPFGNFTDHSNLVNQNNIEVSALTADNEILTPADGDCLYTTVFVGYLLPVIFNQAQFAERLFQLIGSFYFSSESLRWDLTHALAYRDINYFKFSGFKEMIKVFRTHMSLNNGLWGGIDEINIIAQRLNIVIQEMFVNPNYSQVGDYYTTSDSSQNTNNLNLEQPEIIFILRTNPTPEESRQVSADVDLQMAQTESALSAHHLQHYRLISTAPINSIEENLKNKGLVVTSQQYVEQSQNFDLRTTKAVRTISAAKDIDESFQALFNPFESQKNNTDAIQSAVELITGRPDTTQLFARAPEFINKNSNYPHLKSSEYNTLTQLMVRVGMRERPQHFASLPQDEPVTEDASFGVAFNFLKEFVQGGALDIWSSHFRQVITNQESNNENQAALEFFDGITNLVKNMMNAPEQSPIDKYVDPEDIRLLEEARSWLKANTEHPNYDRIQEAFMKLHDKTQASRERALTEGGEHMVSLYKRMRPEFSNKDQHEILAHQEAEWQTRQRQEFEKYILEYYGKSDPFEPNHIRAFWETMFRRQYGKICYKIVCESFEKQYKESRLHQLVKQIWAVSQLDTIHHQPQEAKSRMPGKSFDGKYAPNFGYKIEKSNAYQKWITNSVVRANADIIMDAYHTMVDFGRELDIPKFIERFLDHLSDDREVRLSMIKYPHKYDNFMIVFELYLLESVYQKPFVVGEGSITEQILKAAGSEDKLLEIATQALNDFKSFAHDMFSLRPTTEETRTQKTDGLVFGIGFNGKQFDSPRNSQANTDEIWLSFSSSARKPGGYLLLALMKEVATQHSSWLTPIVANQSSQLAHNYIKYQALIRQHVKAQLKELYKVPDYHWDTYMLKYVKKERNKFESFLIQLDANISFEKLSSEFKQWSWKASNWYRISPGVAINIPGKMPDEEHAAQNLARELLFDALIQRPFSVDYPELIAPLFLHWKKEVLSLLADKHFEKKLSSPLRSSQFGSLFGFDYISEKPKIVAIVKKASTLDEVPEGFQTEVIDILNHLVSHIHPELKLIWEPAIKQEYEKFTANYLTDDIEKAKKNVKKKQASFDNAKNKGNTKGLSNMEAALTKAKEHLEQLELQQQQLPKQIIELSQDQYIKFRNYFFENRDVSQCVEPVFARVLGHDRFFSVYISKKTGETTMLVKDASPLQLGNFIPQDVIAPCNRRCQHHALGHLYTGDMLAHQSADQLDQMRQTHELGEVPDRFMTFNHTM